MRSRGLLIAFLTVVVALLVPAAAFASTYTWSQPGDFTTTSPGANPEHKYGQPSWSYRDGFGTNLPAFGSLNGTNLTGWANSTSSPATWVAVPSSGKPTDVDMVPPSGGSVELDWVSPLDGSVNVSGSVTQANPPMLPVCGFTWTLTDDGTQKASGTNTGSISSQSMNVSSGSQILLTVTDSTALPVNYSPQCDTAAATLTITAPATPPTPTLSSPASGKTLTNAQPTFTGTGSTGFGDQPDVTIHVCSGSVSQCHAGTVQNISTTVSNGHFSAHPSSMLPNGTYTAQVEQDLNDLDDPGFSSPSTFTVHDVAPTITLDAPPHEPLTTTTPTFTGKADTTTGDLSTVYLFVYPGTGTSRPRVRTLTGTRSSTGAFSIKVTPGLPNGRYTAVAYQRNRLGQVGASKLVPFTIQLNPPTVTIGTPVALSRSNIASVPISCVGTAAQSCSGDVMVLTTKSYQTTPGGPTGQLRLLFAYVTIAGGKTQLVTRSVPSSVASTLRHAGSVQVKVSMQQHLPGGGSRTSSAIRTLKIS